MYICVILRNNDNAQNIYSFLALFELNISTGESMKNLLFW